MNRMTRLALAVIGSLLVLALALSLAPASPLQAQDPQPGDRRAPAEPPAAEPPDSANAASAALQLPGAALRPEFSAAVETATDNTNYGCAYVESGNASVFWNAPIYPPQGATLTSLRVNLYDASASNSTVYLAVLGANGDLVHSWFASSTGSGGWTYFVISIDGHVVDYNAYSYILWWKPNAVGDTMMLCGLRLYYTPPGGLNHMPAVMNDY